MSRYIYIFAVLVVVLILANTSFAVDVTIPEGTPITLDTLATLLNNIALFLIFAGTVMAVIFLIWSGIEYVMAGSDSKKVADAKQRLKVGLIGSLIIFGVGTIIATLRIIGSGDINGLFG